MSKQPKKFKDSHDPLFAQFALEVQRAIAKNDDGTSQKQQFEELIASEHLFHDTILNSRLSTEIYKKFIAHIKVTNKNILSARPYFRESAITFSRQITPALKAADPEALKVFGINFQFIKFCKDNWIGPWPKKIEAIYLRVERARTIIISNNLPLAINRAKIFFRKIPKGKSHLSFQDLIEISAMGLYTGIDKYNGPFKKNFIGMCIGRIVGNFIDANTETLFHFYPGDKRTIYRANMIRGRQGVHDIAELAKAVNDSFAKEALEGKNVPKPITVSELAYLMHAASLISADANSGEEGFGVYSFTPDSADSVEEVLSKKQELSQMTRLARKLPLINQKILRLKGIEI